MSDRGYLTVVSGLPRTGTSMMMRMLEAGGMEAVKDDIRAADVDNPNGYYEFERVKKIKDDSSWLSGAAGKAFKMVSMLLYELPRKYEYRVVFIERDMDEMMASQVKMLERLGKPGGGDEDDMKALYTKHLAEVKAWLGKQKNVSVLYVNYNTFMSDPEAQAAAVAGFLGGGLDTAKMAAVIDKGLYRNRAGK